MNFYSKPLTGNCVGEDPRKFFPSSGRGYVKAKRICDGCGVKTECLERTLMFELETITPDHKKPLRFGVAGGLSAAERSRIYDAGAV